MTWQQQRSMSGPEFRAIVKRLGISRAAAGRFLGISERTIRRVSVGQSQLPVAATLLLRAMLEHGDVPLVPKRPPRLDATSERAHVPASGIGASSGEPARQDAPGGRPCPT